MDIAQLKGAPFSETTEAARGNMARHALSAGWESLSERKPAQTFEQEGIAIRLPTADNVA